MARTLEEIVADMHAAQAASLSHQRELSQHVNESIAGGIDGVGRLADSLAQLRRRPMPIAPSYGDGRAGAAVSEPSALAQVLARIAQAQLDATRRNDHIATAVNGAVAAGGDALVAAARGLRDLHRLPEGMPPQPEYQEALDRVRATARGDDFPPVFRQTSEGDDPAGVHICPTCHGSGRVTYR